MLEHVEQGHVPVALKARGGPEVRIHPKPRFQVQGKLRDRLDEAVAAPRQVAQQKLAEQADPCADVYESDGTGGREPGADDVPANPMPEELPAVVELPPEMIFEGCHV
jgi:hypothetical protein